MKIATALLVLMTASRAMAHPDIVHRTDIPEVRHSHYTEQTFAFPTGSVRVRRMEPGGRARLTDESELFVLTGAATVQVDGTTVTLGAGDAAYRPTGVLAATAPETLVVAWSVRSLAPAAPKVVRNGTMDPEPVANWIEPDGRQVYLRGKAQMAGVTIPPTASQWQSRRYEFSGNSIRWANFAAGGRTVLATPATDNLVFITKSPMRRIEGAETVDLQAGDVVREETGVSGYWELTGAAGFLSTTAPPR